MSYPHCNHPPARRGAGFSLIELMIVVAVIAILAAIAVPSYMKYTIRTHRTAAESCLSEYANYMERYYTTNMRYDQDTAGTALTLPTLGCKTDTASEYNYQFASGEPTQTTFNVQAVPIGNQLAKDTQCGTLSINQTGQRTASGTDPTSCW
ncbi:MAG: prepilin-type N-terminal cleavage/methylation domain-containing protein [Xanthomonadaceae bacterium]|nr:prepilin-type N-terminal cleavage/methylation domain-containing protein [Xanthomonadaceae bacterium]MDE1964459.1 prepilin-type N-terminal cleavage/methylation domain-containing protein [Xanthomonadaceae bacterium]